MLKKAAKRIKTNKEIIDNLNSNSPESDQTAEQSIDEDRSEIQLLVDFMKTCDVSKDLVLIKDYHKKSFVLRQHCRQSNAAEKLISEFPRFFDVDGLVNFNVHIFNPISFTLKPKKLIFID